MLTYPLKELTGRQFSVISSRGGVSTAGGSGTRATLLQNDNYAGFHKAPCGKLSWKTGLTSLSLSEKAGVRAVTYILRLLLSAEG